MRVHGVIALRGHRTATEGPTPWTSVVSHTCPSQILGPRPDRIAKGLPTTPAECSAPGGWTLLHPVDFVCQVSNRLPSDRTSRRRIWGTKLRSVDQGPTVATGVSRPRVLLAMPIAAFENS